MCVCVCVCGVVSNDPFRIYETFVTGGNIGQVLKSNVGGLLRGAASEEKSLQG